MTRMLLNLFLAITMLSTLSSCGLFEEDKDTVLLDTAKSSADSELSDDEDFEDKPTSKAENKSDSVSLSEADKLSEDLGMDDEADFADDGDAPVTKTEEPEPSISDLEADLEDAEFGDTKPLEESDKSLFADSPQSEQESIKVKGASADAVGKIVDLQYRAFEGSGTVVIQTNNQVEYSVRELPDTNQVVLEISNVKLPDHLKRPYITKDFYQDVAIINAYQDSGSTTARFIIQYNKAVNPIVTQEGKMIYVKSDTDVKMAAANASQEKLNAQAQETSSLHDQEVGKNFQPLEREGIYTGRKIHIELDDVDVKQAIHLIAEQSGANIIVDADVQGKTTIKLRNVPWDQALSVILKSKGLGYVRQANVLRIATQANLTKEAQDLKRFLEDQKDAKMAAAGVRVKMIPISYADVEELDKQLKNFLSKDGKITHDKRTSALVVTDYQDFIDRASEVIQSLDIPPKQVLIEAKIVEARDTFLRQSGFNWGAAGKSFTTGAQSGSVNLNNGVKVSAPGGMALDLNIGTFDVLGDLTAAFALAEKNEDVKILSSPKVVVLNNVQSTIKQITQVPIRKVVAVQAGTEQTADYKDLELLLQVTPQITFAGNVILKVLLKRDFAGAQDAVLKAVEINKREANTQIMVKNGQTAVIGGVYQSDATKSETGTPFLKEIPLLGYLFKNQIRDERKNELAIFIKPTILGEAFSNNLATNTVDPNGGSKGTDVKDEDLDKQLGDDIEKIGEDEGLE